MARRLSASLPGRSGGRRTAGFVVLIVAVVATHFAVTRYVAASMAELDPQQAMPVHIEVAYVKTLELEKPQAPAAPARPPPPAAPAPMTIEAVEHAASAASSPERKPKAKPEEPVVAVAARDAASAPPPPPAASASASANEPLVATAMATATPSPASAPAGTTAPSTATAAGFVWPTATRVSYILNGNLRGEVNGKAEVEWIRIDQRYQVNVDMHAGPSFSPVFSRRMTSEGRIVPEGLSPDRYDEETKVMMKDNRRVNVTFAADSVTLANGQQRERMAGVQDTASQFIQFTWMFGSQPDKLKVGNSFEFPLALPRSLSTWTYDVDKEETLNTPFGPIATFHLKPRPKARRANEWAVDMWFAPELRFLPVRIRIEQESGTFVDLTIAKKPEIAGP